MSVSQAYGCLCHGIDPCQEREGNLKRSEKELLDLEAKVHRQCKKNPSLKKLRLLMDIRFALALVQGKIAFPWERHLRVNAD